MKPLHIIFTVTNELSYDQRMQRICSTLAGAGYRVTLTGFSKKGAPPLQDLAFRQKRLPLLFRKGKFFYLEYNFRLFCWLLFQRADCFCAIDLDTIIPVYWASVLRSKKRVYDAHELFCEMKEVVSRPLIYRFWKQIEKRYLPRFRFGYTVNQPIADIFKKEYGVDYAVVRNVPEQVTDPLVPEKEDFLLYQGAVNEGRLFEVLIPSMQWVDVPLHIYGDGNFMEQVRHLVAVYQLENKVLLKGKLLPGELRKLTPRAKIGFTLFENNGLSNYYSLANRFFDYVHAVTPQICIDFPVYRELNKEAPVAVLVKDPLPETLAASINWLLENPEEYRKLQDNCRKMRSVWNWQQEQELLLDFYRKILP